MIPRPTTDNALVREYDPSESIRPISRLKATLLVTVLSWGAIALAMIFLEAFGNSNDTRADKSTIIYSCCMGALWLLTVLALAFTKRNALERHVSAR